MTFALPAFLAAGLLCLVVLVLHTTQRRTLTVSSVQLWRQIQRHATQRRRVWRMPKLSVLLILQLLAVILAALALAQPLWGARAEPEHWVFVLDGSASMQAADGETSRFEAARNALVARLDQADPHVVPHVSIILAATRPSLVAARLSEVTEALEQRVDALEPFDGPADWESTARLVSQVATANEPTHILLFTDGADAGASALSGAVAGARLEEARFGSDLPGASITGTLVADPAPRREGNLLLSGAVRLTGVNSVPLVVDYLADGSTTSLEWTRRAINVSDNPDAAPPSEPVTRSFDESLDLPGPGLVRARIEDPASPFDNTVNFVVGTADPSFDILYIGPRDPALLRALRAIDGAAIFEADGLPADLSQFELTVIDSIEVSRLPETNALWVGSARVAGEEVPAELAGQDFTNWQETHPLGFGVDWSGVAFSRAFALPVPPGAEVVVEASDNPMLAARTIPNGRDVHLAFRPSESNWAELPSFPLFVANLVDWLGPRATGAVQPSCTIGLPCALDARIVGAGFTVADAWVTDPAAMPGPPPAIFDAEDGRLIAQKAGFYRLTSGERTYTLAINAPASGESDLAPLPSAVAGAEPLSPLLRLAPWLLGALALVLAVEGWIAGRGPERFLRLAGLSRRNPRAPARRALLGLRLATLALVIAALAGLPLLWPEARQNVVVVAAGPNPLADQVAAQAGGDRRGAVVDAALAPHVRLDLAADRDLAPGVETQHADIKSALRLAVAMLPPGEPGRIALAAPATAGVGQFTDAIAPLRIAGVPVDVLPAPASANADLAMSRVGAPPRLYVGDAFDLSGLVYAPTEQQAVIRIFENGDELATQDVSLLPGFNWVDTRIGEAKRGATLYEMAISGDNDAATDNDRAGVEVEALATPRILIVSPQPQQGQLMADLLTSQGFEASLIPPDRAFWKLDEWLGYDSFILMNVPALDLQTRQQELIEEAVSQHGRGLFIMGGENTFGPGGYFETPLERLSPVSSRVPRESPEAALVFVLDRSGSMSQAVGNVNRLDIAKEATRAAVGLLNKQSRVAIIVFDSEAHVILPITQSVDPEQVERALASFDAGGGTSIYPGLEEAIRQLQGVDAPARHIIVMTDGLTQRGDFATLLNRAREQNISVSGVAIGRGADISSVKEIATLGGGSFHTSVDFQALPSILSQEALLLSGTPIEEGVTVPRWTPEQQQRFLAALPDALPAISGFVLTTPKPDADLAITVTDGEGETMPLLATWRYGNGQVLSLTTQGVGAWSERWVDMPEYPKMLADTLRAFLPSTQTPGFNLAAQRRGDEVLVRLDALDDVGNPLSGLEPSGEALALGQAEDALPLAFRLVETGPGRYEGSFPATESGIYEIAAASADQVAKRRLFIGYPAALDPGMPRQNFDLLASATGGRVLNAADSAFVDVPTRLAALPGWPLWTAMALMLFMVDLFVRYGNPLAGWFNRPSRQQRAPAPSSAGSSTPTGTFASQDRASGQAT